MTNEDIATKLADTDSRSRSNTHRLDYLEKRQDNLDDLVKSVSALANEQEHIKSDVTEIKTDVKALTAKPGKRWDGIVDKIILTAVGILIAYVAVKAGLA